MSLSPELGYFALLVALPVVLLQTSMPWLARHYQPHSHLLSFTFWAATAQTMLVLFAYLCLSYAFATNDFSVRYVATHSNTHLPMFYKLAAVWGAHEGSLLLWVLILALWTQAVVLFSRQSSLSLKAQTVAVLGFISTGFILFILFLSNPFERLLPAPNEGSDLNPLLQDPGMVIHPPLLYMGYVGLAVAFALAVVALINKRLDPQWARWVRPWTLSAWSFLTLGIALGSWWAYHELGWGGWWFWDPVENASFMPWLVATALIHSLIVNERRDTFKSWTVLLAILAFSLSLLGTFLVRSGVLVSVHAFASDPQRGLYILIFLAIVSGGALLLYAMRANSIHSKGAFTPFSRETFLLINNVLLLVSAAVILVATLYPLFMDALNLGKISIGPPYFNQVFVPLALPLLLLAGIGPLLGWHRAGIHQLKSVAKWLLIPVLLLATLVPIAMGAWSALVFVAVAMALWTILTMLYMLTKGIREGRQHIVSMGFFSMAIAHIGLGVFAIGVTLTSVYSSEKELAVHHHERVHLAGYEFELLRTEEGTGPNYRSFRGVIQVYDQHGQVLGQLYPERRIYTAKPDTPMAEAAIHQNVFRDLYVALGEPHGDSARQRLRLYHRPFIRWIWTGAAMMALAGFLAAYAHRKRQHV